MKSISKNIKEIRIKRNIKQEELAEKLFVTRQTVSNYENGKSQPDIDMLLKIAEALDTDINSLLYGEAKEPKADAINKEQFIKKLIVIFALWAACCYCAYRTQTGLASPNSGYYASFVWLNIYILQPTSFIVTAYLLADYLPRSIDKKIKDNIFIKLLWCVTLVLIIIMVVSTIPDVIKVIIYDTLRERCRLANKDINFEYYGDTVRLEKIDDIIFMLSSALGYQIRYKFWRMTYATHIDIPVYIIAGVLLNVLKPDEKLCTIAKRAFIALVCAVVIASAGLTAASLEKAVPNEEHKLWNIDYSPWLRQENTDDKVIYSAMLFEDGDYSGYSTDPEASKGALICLSNLRTGREVDITFPKSSGHVMVLEKVEETFEGIHGTTEIYTIVFSEDYKYVRLAYSEDTRVYTVKNPYQIAGYFAQYANK